MPVGSPDPRRAASKLGGLPVRITLSRQGVFRIVGGRTTTQQRVALGAKADGTLAALIHTSVAAMTSHNNFPEQFTFPRVTCTPPARSRWPRRWQT
jgi:xanthine dehydrogenase YagR molybdenum-binding subunit